MTEINRRIDSARALLTEPPRRDNPWAILSAAALAAGMAVMLAGVVVLGPGVRFVEPTAATAPDR